MTHKFYSDIFQTSSALLKQYDVFNGFIDKDSLYYIVPSKLQNIGIDEFKDSYDKYKMFFQQIITILNQSNGNDIFYKKVVKLYQLKEIANIGLGYSKNNKSGSAIGIKLAKKLTETSYQLIQAGIKDPEIFQLVGLLEEGIGADRISDITIGILIEDFLEYTQNVSKSLNIQTKSFIYNNKQYKLPQHNNSFIIFCPKSILTDLPVAFDRDDIGRVCSHNENLRLKVNNIIAESFTKVGIREFKYNLKKLLLTNPKLANEMIQEYKNKSTIYNFDEDPNGDFIWKDIADETVVNYPFQISEQSPIKIVELMCNKFRDLVEYNGLWKFFHNSDGGHKNEAFAQMLFFSIAHSYCEANNLDISPEVNSGRGPVDFKVSAGFSDKINIEMKLSTNGKLLDGYTKQLPIYDKAEKANYSIFLIVLLHPQEIKKINKVYAYRKKHETIDNKLPEIVVVDATYRKSASKA
jgi:hypothetical protein